MEEFSGIDGTHRPVTPTQRIPIEGHSDASTGPLNSNTQSELHLSSTLAVPENIRPWLGPDLAETLSRLRDLDAGSYSTDEVHMILEYIVEALAPSSDNLDVEVHRKAIHQLQRWCHHVQRFPRSFYLEGALVREPEPFFQTPSSDMYKATYGSRAVAVKVLRVIGPASDVLKKAYCDEALLWKLTDHDNIVPLLGVMESGPGGLHLVMEWMENGTVIQFIKNALFVRKWPLVADILQGLQYLHLRGMAHGDLKGANILVDNRRRARLSDFGHTVHLHSGLTNSAVHRESTIRWTCPEYLDEPQYGTLQERQFAAQAADVYSCGMVIWEIFTLEVPFHHLNRPSAIISAIKNGHRPSRPSSAAADLELDDRAWDMVQKCWLVDPKKRPTTAEMCKLIAQYSIQRRCSPARRKLTARYLCDICGTTFTRAYNLRYHLYAHDNKRPYECKVCGKDFVRRSDLSRHCRNRHGVSGIIQPPGPLFQDLPLTQTPNGESTYSTMLLSSTATEIQGMLFENNGLASSSALLFGQSTTPPTGLRPLPRSLEPDSDSESSEQPYKRIRTEKHGRRGASAGTEEPGENTLEFSSAT